MLDVKRKTHVLHDNDNNDDNQRNPTHQLLFQILNHDRARTLNAQHQIDVTGEHQTLLKLTEMKQPIQAK